MTERMIRQNRSWHGAIIGCAALGLSALLLGPGLAESYYGEGSHIAKSGYVFLALAGSGVGAILGGVIGWAIPKRSR